MWLRQCSLFFLFSPFLLFTNYLLHLPHFFPLIYSHLPPFLICYRVVNQAWFQFSVFRYTISSVFFFTVSQSTSTRDRKSNPIPPGSDPLPGLIRYTETTNHTYVSTTLFFVLQHYIYSLPSKGSHSICKWSTDWLESSCN